MNAAQLQLTIVNAVNQSIQSGGTTPATAIAILEVTKLGVYTKLMEMQSAQAQKKIVTPPAGVIEVPFNLPRGAR